MKFDNCRIYRATKGWCSAGYNSKLQIGRENCRKLSFKKLGGRASIVVNTCNLPLWLYTSRTLVKVASLRLFGGYKNSTCFSAIYVSEAQHHSRNRMNYHVLWAILLRELPSIRPADICGADFSICRYPLRSPRNCEAPYSLRMAAPNNGLCAVVPICHHEKETFPSSDARLILHWRRWTLLEMKTFR